MLEPRKRLWSLLGLIALAIPLSAAALASACTGLATVATSASAAAPGAKITVNGSGFVAHDASDSRTEPAMIRFDTLDGPVIATASPTSQADGGKFSVEITVPALAPGEHVVVTTQNGTDGRPAYGTPARQAFTVTPAPAPPPPPPAPPTTVELPVLSQTFMTPAPPSAEALLRSAINRCKQRHSASKSKTKAGKRRLAKRRAACIADARKRLG
jgi:hypothetical protein